MKRRSGLILFVLTLVAAGLVRGQAPVLSSIESPNLPLQNTQPITMAGRLFTAGMVSIGQAGTPIILAGSNLGDSGSVWFVSYKNGAVDANSPPVQAPYSLWSPTEIIATVPPGAATGLVVVITNNATSNGLPFIVMAGTYTGVCSVHSPVKELQIQTSSLPDGTLNNAYSLQLSATGGTQSYTWSQIGGTLPAGLQFSSSGLLSGTPTQAAGQQTITVQVADSGNPQQKDVATLSIEIASHREAESSSALYNFNIQDAGGNSGYDAVGNVTNYKDSINGQWSFNYDTLNRLTGGSSATNSINGITGLCYGYDAFGNRIISYNQACSGQQQNAYYNSNNQLNSGLQSYDAAGNMTWDSSTGNSYLYDGEGRVCAVQQSYPTLGITKRTQYIYDAEGTRVAKGSITQWSCDTASNGFTPTTAYVLGPHNEQLTEMANTAAAGQTPVWQWAHTNVQAGALSANYDSDPSGQTEGNLYFHLSDWLGTRRQQTDYAGNPVLNFTGLPYGDGLSTIPVSNLDAADATEHHFTGKERDQESGNDYFGARYYASTMGRWLSPDLINVTEERLLNPANTLNKYAYGANNPLKYVDPDGRDITIYYEAGNPYPGHTMLLAYNQATGDSATRSFGPDHSRANIAETAVGIPVPGTDRFGYEDIKSPDDLRKNYTSLTIQTTPEEAQEVIDAIRAHPDGNYTTYWNNCTTTCSKLLRMIKQTSSHALTPGTFFQDLWGQEHGGSGRYQHFFQRGQDYGHPRQGYDSFQMFFWLMGSNDKSSVTTTETYSIDCQKNPGACK